MSFELTISADSACGLERLVLVLAAASTAAGDGAAVETVERIHEADDMLTVTWRTAPDPALRTAIEAAWMLHGGSRADVDHQAPKRAQRGSGDTTRPRA